MIEAHLGSKPVNRFWVGTMSGMGYLMLFAGDGPWTRQAVDRSSLDDLVGWGMVRCRAGGEDLNYDIPAQGIKFHRILRQLRGQPIDMVGSTVRSMTMSTVTHRNWFVITARVSSCDARAKWLSTVLSKTIVVTSSVRIRDERTRSGRPLPPATRFYRSSTTATPPSARASAGQRDMPTPLDSRTAGARTAESFRAPNAPPLQGSHHASVAARTTGPAHRH